MIKKLFGLHSNDKSLDKLFYPSSIAVVGASNDVNKIGGFVFSEVKSSNVIPYPINNKETQVQGIKAYMSVSEIGKQVDLCIIAIPKDFVLNVVRDCASAGVKNIVIITAGFKEVGEEGKKREEELKNLIEVYKLNIIGPNCLGILNAEIGLNCSFAKECPKSGDIALVSQSGAVIDGIIDWSFEFGVGFSKIVSLGNMAGVDALKILEYLKDDPKTKSIVFYMETLERGEEFGSLLKEISKNKPVVVIKPGNSDNAKKAIGSHTGSLAQDNILVKTLIEQSGGIFVKSLNELFNVLIGLKCRNLPKGKNTVILTNAGGVGVIATDCISNSCFKLFEMTVEDKKRFGFLPKEASVNNPIDILGDAKSDRYLNTLNELEKFGDVDNVFVLLTPQIMTDVLNVAKIIVDFSKSSKKCVFCSFLGGKEIKEGVKFLEENGVACFETPIEAVTSMNYLYSFSNFSTSEHVRKYVFNEFEIASVKKKLENRKGLLDFEMTKEVMKVFKISLPHKVVVRDAEEILKLKLNANKRYVLKADSVNLIHKKDVGGVRVGILGSDVNDELFDMFGVLSKKVDDFTITVEEEFNGTEVIVGLKSDFSLGNFIMFGLGGTNVEIYNDVNLSVCPLDLKGSEELVKRSKAFKLLNGFRGTKKVDFEHLYEILVRMSYLQKVFPEIREVDLNPVICNYKGIYLVDVKLIL